MVRIVYIGVFNFTYTIFLCLKLGMKDSLRNNFGYKVYVVFLILVFYTIFSIVFDILQGSYFGDFCSGAP